MSETTLFEFESADSSLAGLDRAALAPAFSLLPRFELRDGECLAFKPVVGPETPFPEHLPLRQVAALRTLHARFAAEAGDMPTAMAGARLNLAHARANLEAQAGVLPFIHATGVWQSALDTIQCLARHPNLSAADARVLLGELQADSGLVARALKRSMAGEYTGVFQVVVDRMPDTDDPDLLLSSVATLGMEAPTPLPPGELGLGLTSHPLLDRSATYEAYRRDLAHYFAALDRSSTFPHGLYAATTARTLAGYRKELGDFYLYATGEDVPTWGLLQRARADLEAVTNPGGKLITDFLTPAWEPLIASAMRREAQRNAVIGLLAWRLHGHPAPWSELIASGLLDSAPVDPFAAGAPLLISPGPAPRIWSVAIDARDDGGQLVPGNSGQPADLVWLW